MWWRLWAITRDRYTPFSFCRWWMHWRSPMVTLRLSIRWLRWRPKRWISSCSISVCDLARLWRALFHLSFLLGLLCSTSSRGAKCGDFRGSNSWGVRDRYRHFTNISVFSFPGSWSFLLLFWTFSMMMMMTRFILLWWWWPWPFLLLGLCFWRWLWPWPLSWTFVSWPWLWPMSGWVGRWPWRPTSGIKVSWWWRWRSSKA